jgi:rod shape-determining protein MreD
MTERHNNGLFIFLTIIIAFLLTLLPMPGWAIWLRPSWVLMVLIYWTIANPEQVNVGIAWMIGILLDVLQGTLLGEHALAMTIVIYFVVRMVSRLRMYPLMQQGLSIMVLVLVYQSILFCIQGFLGSMPQSWMYWSSSLTSMLLWPWVAGIMRSSRRFKTI